MINPSAKTISRPSGFTLAELLVAIALLLIIMVSVSAIFRSASDAAGVGMAITQQNRAVAGAAAQLQQDITGYSTDNPLGGHGMWPVNAVAPNTPPFLFIHTVARPGYRNLAAENAGNRETFRQDSIGFFAKGQFSRQTGMNTVVEEMPPFASAYIWYGHLALPNSAGAYDAVSSQPGLGDRTTNPNNFYAQQWILGRRAILMADVIPDATPDAPGEGTIPGGYYFYARPLDANTTNPLNFTPLGNDRRDQTAPGFEWTLPRRIDNDASPVNSSALLSRIDVAGMNRQQTWAQYADLVQQYQTAFETGAPGYAVQWVKQYFSRPYYAELVEHLDIDWTQNTVNGNKTTFVNTATQSVPVMLRNCTNFIVEFAGDYVSQNPDGTLIGGPYTTLSTADPATWHMDGVLDFDVVNGAQQIRWYGWPRDVDGDGSIDPIGHGDVISVTQMRMWNMNPSGWAVPFERWDASGADFYYRAGWTKDMLSLPASGTPALSLAPKLIRLTVQVADPAGRVLDDMTRQYVFPVKYE